MKLRGHSGLCLAILVVALSKDASSSSRTDTWLCAPDPASDLLLSLEDADGVALVDGIIKMSDHVIAYTEIAIFLGAVVHVQFDLLSPYVLHHEDLFTNVADLAFHHIGDSLGFGFVRVGGLLGHLQGLGMNL